MIDGSSEALWIGAIFLESWPELREYRAGALFQPVHKGLRPDKHSPDAYASLKFKPETAETD